MQIWIANQTVTLVWANILVNITSLANIPIDCMLLESEFRELEAFRESKMIKRLEWNVNEEIAEDILKADEKYNMYENSHTFLIIHSTYFQNLHF